MSSVSMQSHGVSKRDSVSSSHPKRRSQSNCRLCKMERRVSCLLHPTILCTKWCTTCFTWHCDKCDGHREHQVQDAEKILTELEDDLMKCTELLERLRIENVSKIDKDRVEGNLSSVEKKIREAASARKMWHQQQMDIIDAEEKALLSKAKEEYQEVLKHVERERQKVQHHHEEVSARKAHVSDLQIHANSQRLTNEVKQLFMHVSKMHKPEIVRPGKLAFRFAPISTYPPCQLGILSVDHSRQSRSLGEGSVHCISLIGDQRQLIIGSNRHLATHTTGGDLIEVLHVEETISASWSPDGRFYWVGRINDDNTLYCKADGEIHPDRITELGETSSVHSIFVMPTGNIIIGGMNLVGEGVLSVWTPLCREKRWSMILPFGKLQYSNDLTVCGTDTFIGVTCLTAQELMVVFNYIKNSTVMKYAASGVVKHPRGMCLTDRGDLVVADYEARQLHIFTSRGEHQATIDVGVAVLDVVYDSRVQKLYYINYQPSELYSIKILDPNHPSIKDKK